MISNQVSSRGNLFSRETMCTLFDAGKNDSARARTGDLLCVRQMR